jgi:hypothetical protein
VILKLKDHDGNPLSGGTGRGGYGSTYSTWHVSGTTDANGILVDMRNGLATTMSYEMRYNNTTEHKTQDVSANSIIEFQTQLMTLRLETCSGTPLEGGPHVTVAAVLSPPGGSLAAAQGQMGRPMLSSSGDLLL